MAGLGFEINDYSMACVVNMSGSDTIPVSTTDGANAIGLNTTITPAGPVFGNIAQCALLAQPELPATSELLSAGAKSHQWYQDSSDKHWRAPELLQTLMSQLMTSARDVAFERHWQATVAVESACRSLLTQWLTQPSQGAECQIQAIVSRQTALAAHWSARQPGTQTVISIDWAPRQIHLGIFTCSNGSFKLLRIQSVSNVGLIELEKVIAHALLPGADDSISSRNASPELAAAIAKLCQQALCDASGVGKQECWLGGELRELVLCQDQLRELVRPFSQRVQTELSGLLAQLGLNATDADRVLLVGGPHEILRTELISRMQISPEACVGLTGSSAIADGAAILSGLAPARLREIVRADDALHTIQHGDQPERDLSERLASCDIGLRIGNPLQGKSVIYKLIDAAAGLPTRRTRTFRTSRLNQTRLILELVYVQPTTGRVLHQETRSLQLPSDLAAYTPIEVSVLRHHSGQVEIAASAH